MPVNCPAPEIYSNYLHNLTLILAFVVLNFTIFSN